MAFFDDLTAATAEECQALYAVPLIQDGAHGRISRETYIAYLTQAYHHVKHTVPLLMAAASRLPDEKLDTQGVCQVHRRGDRPRGVDFERYRQVRWRC